MLRASRTSAEPERELTDRLPHLMTRQPPAATMRGDVEGVGAGAAGAGGVEDAGAGDWEGPGGFEEGAGGAGDVRCGFAAGFEGGEEGGDVDVGVVAVGEGFKSGLGFVGGGVGVGEVGDEVVDEVHDAGPFGFCWLWLVLVEEGSDAPVEDDGAGGAEDAFWVELQSDCCAFGGVGGGCHDDGAGGGL